MQEGREPLAFSLLALAPPPMIRLPLGVMDIAVAGAILDVLRWLFQLPSIAFQAYAWLLESAVDWVRSLFEQYGYWVVFLGTLLENTLFVGLVVPGVIIIVLAGIGAQDGAVSLPLVLGLSILRTVLGDTASYFMG